MQTATAQARAQWQTSSGFVLAALGAAIGLGNIWRFSYVAGENGGGAFLFVYAATVLLVGFPILLAELAVGRATGREAASAFLHLGRRRPWRQFGILGVVVSFLILTYYAVVAGWALKYFVVFASGFFPATPGVAAAYFEALVRRPVEPVFWQALVIGGSAAIVIRGIERGIERANKMLMPALALILIALALHSLTLPGVGAGLTFLFRFEWAALAEPRIYLVALGQAFFSLGLAMGALVTYGSYLPGHSRLPAMGAAVVLGDTLFAIVAAVAIFPAVFSFGMDPAQGPGLAFVTLPEIFGLMPAGQIVGAAFFCLLVIAALTSSVALLEVPVASIIELWGLPRRRATLFVAAGAFLLGIPSALGFGVLSGIRIADLPILGAVDFVASNVLLPLSALAITLFLGWHWNETQALASVGFRSRRAARLWRLSVRYVAPTVILLILFRSLAIL